jgi:hypothetical protein
VVQHPNFKRVLIYDPDRRPPDWTGLLSSPQVAVLLSDVHRGQELDTNGDVVANRSDSSCYLFGEYGEAEEFCRNLVLRFPNVKCELFDRRGRASDPLAIFVHPSTKPIDSPRQAKLLFVAGIVVFLSSIPLFYFDWTRGGGLILPSVIAVNCVGAGLRLAYWGGSILLRRKKQLTTDGTMAGR